MLTNYRLLLSFCVLCCHVQLSYCFPRLKFFGPTTKSIPQTRDCNPENNEYPYTGFRLDRQITFNNRNKNGESNEDGLVHETHLIMCKEGRIVQNIVIPLEHGFTSESVPWGSEVCNLSGSSCYRIARSKSNVLKRLSFFLPNTFVGGIFEANDSQMVFENIKNPSGNSPHEEKEVSGSNHFVEFNPLVSLVASDLFRQWIEVKYNGEITYHIPLLHSPIIRTKNHATNAQDPESWSKSVSSQEIYDFDSETKMKYQKVIDNVMNEVTSLMHDNKDKINDLLQRHQSHKDVVSEKSIYSNWFDPLFGSYVRGCLIKKYKENGTLMPFVLLSHILSKAQFYKLADSFNSLIGLGLVQ